MAEIVSAILASVKLDLGISNTVKDSVIQDSIASAKQELRMHGVRAIDEEDPLTAQALKFYCRGFFNFQGDGERYMKAFEHLADSMALSGDYNTVIPDEQ